MPTCETCGNEYDKTFDIVKDGKTHTFDCFECAIHAMAPTCPVCEVRVVGHGVEAGGNTYCCAHCAERAGASAIKDRA